MGLFYYDTVSARSIQHRCLFYILKSMDLQDNFPHFIC